MLRTRRGAVQNVVLSLVVASLALSGDIARAQVIDPLTPRVQFNIPGKIELIGNMSMTCSTDAALSGNQGAAACVNARNRQGTLLDNNNFFMEYIQDGSIPGALNSSSATLTLGPNDVVVWAGLYWMASTGGGAATGTAPNQIAAGQSNQGPIQQVLFKTPTSGSALSITSSETHETGESITANRYVSFADVTALVQAGRDGVYSVGNIGAGTGVNRGAGWTLVVVIGSVDEPLHNLVVFDGLANVTSNSSLTLPVSGFQTPTSGSVDTEIGVVAYEGDGGASQQGDFATLNGTRLSDATRPNNNFFNSSITNLGTSVTSRTPDYNNTLGYDIGLVDATGLIPNGATSATIGLGTTNDSYLLSVVTFETELFTVDLSQTVFKTVTDVNGGDLLPGDTLVYHVAITNSSLDVATNLTLFDTIPANTTYLPGSLVVTTGSNSGTKTDVAGDDQAEFDAAGNRVVFRLGQGANATTGGTLVPDSSTRAEFRVVVNAGTPPATLIRNQGHIAYNSQSTGEAHNNPTDGDAETPGAQPTDIVVAEGADVSIVKSGPTTGTTGVPLIYTLRITNNGTRDATNVVVSDTLPAGMRATAICDGGTNTAVTGGSVIMCPTIPTLAVGAVVEYQFTIIPDSSGTFTDVARANAATLDPDTTNNVSRLTTTAVAPEADVEITKTGPTDAPPNSDMTYTITVTNHGPEVARNVAVQDSLDNGLTFVSSNPAATVSDVGTWAHIINFPAIDSLAVGASVMYTITARTPAQGGVFLDIAAGMATTGDPEPANNNGSNQNARVITTVPGVSDVEIMKTGPPTVSSDGLVTYQLVVINHGPGTALNVVVTDSIPQNSTFVSASDGGTFANGVVTFPAIDSLFYQNEQRANAFVADTFTITVRAPTVTTEGQTLVNIANVSSQFEIDPSNNRDATTTAVDPGGNLSITKTGPDSIGAGSPVTWTITVRNAGPSASTNVVVTDTLPAGFTFVGASNSGTATGQVVTWPAIGSLAPGDSVSYTVVATAPTTPGTSTNIARTTSPTFDPDTTDNRTTTPIVVVPAADLQVVKTAPSSVPADGPTITYQITVTNAGPNAATNVQIVDTLPSAVTFVSASNGGTASGSVVTWPVIASLAAGASVTYTVVVNAPTSATTITNVARASSPTLDPDTTNNRSTATTTVTNPISDVIITKAGPDSVEAGQQFTYAITVRNEGPSTARGIVVTDSIPGGATFVSATGGGTLSGTVVTFPAVDLPNGGEQTYNITLTAPAEGTTLTNVARATVPNDPDSTNNRTTTPTPVVPIADLVATKTGPQLAPGGGAVNYSITITNSGPSTATNVVVADTLPAGVTFVSASNGGTLSGNTVTWPTIASLAPGASVTYTVQVTAPSPPTVLTDVATVSAATRDPNTTNNVASVTTNGGAADLVMTKEAPPSPQTVGQPFTYRVTVRNAGPSTAANVVVTDTLPTGLTFVSATGGGTLSGNVVTWPVIASLAAGSSQSFDVVVNPSTSGTFTNVGAVTSTTPDPDPGNNRDTTTTTVNPSADLAISKTGPELAAAGATVTYSITVTNNGPSPATNVVVTDTLPAGVTFVSASDEGTVNGQVVTWPAIGTLASGASVTYTLTVTAPNPIATFTNVTAVTSATPDPNTGNNTAQLTTNGNAADLIVTKTAPDTGTVGSQLTYHVTVRNAGPATAQNVVVTDTLPATATFVSATGGGTLSGNVVTWPTIPTLAAGASADFQVTIVPDTSGPFTNIVASTSPTPDPDPGSNRDTTTTPISASADVRVAKSGPATAIVGDAITYTITVTNAGPSPAMNVVVADTLPAGVTFTSASNGGTAAGQVVTWPTIPTLASGASVTFTVTGTLTAAGTVTDVATASSTTPDPNLGNNTAQVSTNGTTADISMTKTAPASGTVGVQLTYRVTVRNAGPIAAANVVVTDTLPAGATFVSATGGGTLAGNVITWPTITSLAPGASMDFDVTVIPTTAGGLTNIAAATSPTPDPVPGNNRDTATTAITASADVRIQKTGPALAAAGAAVTYTLTITNDGPSPATNVVVADTLPAGVTFVSASNGGTAAGQVVTWPAVGALAAGASFTFTLQVTAPNPVAQFTNTSTVTSGTSDPNPGNNVAQVTTNGGSSDVIVEKSAPTQQTVGVPATYHVTVRNAGPSTALNVVVTDTLPAGVTFVSATGGGTPSGNVVTWPAIASLAPGASTSFDVVVNPTTAGTFTNIAAGTSTSPDPDTTNNRGTAPFTVIESADLRVAKSGPELAAGGASVTYTITVTNDGPSPATNVVIADTLPASVTFVSASNGGTASGQVVTWPTIPTLAAGASVTYTLQVTAPNPPAAFTDVATATSPTPDPNTGNNTAQVTTNGGAADLVVTKTVPAREVVGQQITYRVTVRNAGPSTAANVVVTDTLPAGLTFISASDEGALSGNVVTWPAIATLAPGASASFDIVVRPDTAGTFTNISAATSPTPDPDTTNNRGTITTTVDPSADVAIEKGAPSEAVAGDSVQYSLTVTNRGPSPATNLVVTDTLPAGVTFLSASDGGTIIGTVGGRQIVQWPAVPVLASGASFTRTISVRMPANGGEVINAAIVTSDTPDPNLGNNITRATTEVPRPPETLQADLSVVKTGPASVAANDSITYSITVTNAGPDTAVDVVVVDRIPPGTTFLSASDSGQLIARTVRWRLSTLAPGASRTFTTTLLAPIEGPLVNTAVTTSRSNDPNPANDTSTVSTPVTPVADVSIVKSPPNQLFAGASSTFTLTVTNAGPNAAQNVVVSDALPAGMTVVSGVPSDFTVSGNTVTWTAIPTLAAGASVQYQLTVQIPANTPSGTLFTDTARVNSTTPDPSPGNNTSIVTTPASLRSDVRIQKSGPPVLAPNSEVQWVISTTNDGPTVATGVVVSDAIPAGVTFLSASNGGVFNDGAVTWPAIDTLRVGQVVSFTVNVRLPASGSFTNTTTATTTSPDPNLANNTDTTVTRVAGNADVGIIKQGPEVANPGQVVTYTLIAFNNGPDTAYNVSVVDSLPAGVTEARAPRDGTPLPPRTIVAFPEIAKLAPGDTVRFTLAVIMPDSGSASDFASVSSISPDPNPANNADTVTTRIRGGDIAIAKRALTPFTIGGAANYVLTVTNVGDLGIAGPITITDTLPAGLTFLGSAVISGSNHWDCSAQALAGSVPPRQIVTCVSPDSLGAGQSTEVQINNQLTTFTTSTIVNRAHVSAPGDLNGSNDLGAATVKLEGLPELAVEKQALRPGAEVGDFLDYAVRIRNLTIDTIGGVKVTDLLPLGFSYVRGSARVDGRPIADPDGSPGPRLIFDVGTFNASQAKTLTYRVAVGPAATAGDGRNCASAGNDNGVTSNQACVRVRVDGGVFTERGYILGRVMLDPPFLGIPGVRVYLEDGTAAITDMEGKFNFFNVSPRLHVVKIDETTLPKGARVLALTSRDAGDGRTKFVDLQRAELFRAEFQIADEKGMRDSVEARRKVKGPDALTLALGGAGRVANPWADGTAYTTRTSPQLPEFEPRVMPQDTTRLGRTSPVYEPLAGDWTGRIGEVSGLSTNSRGLETARGAYEIPQNGALALTLPDYTVPADGASPVIVSVRLSRAVLDSLRIGPARDDSAGRIITLEAEHGHWDLVDIDSTTPGVQTRMRDSVAEFRLLAPPREGPARVRVTYGPLAADGIVKFVPAVRPMIMAGVVQGRIDFRHLSKGSLLSVTPQDAFEDELVALAGSWDDGVSRGGGRAALYLRGKIKGDALLSISYDSERDTSERTFRDIRPEEYYPIYGDASVHVFEAQSYERLYVRLDKNRSFLLFGDYNTGTAYNTAGGFVAPESRARELSAYLRTITGPVAHLENDHAAITVFGSSQRVTLQVDEIPGKGVSGPYVLTSPYGRLNTERVEIITRDRNQPGRILRIVPQERFTDYVLEPFTGHLIFRHPIPSTDEYLNPVSIRISYEIERDIPRFWNYGAEGVVRVGDRLEVGGNFAGDNDPFNNRFLGGVNASLKVTNGTILVGEFAGTNSDSTGGGMAGRFEVRHRSRWADAIAYGIFTDSSFFNRSSTALPGRTELGAKGAFRLTQTTRLLAEALRSDDHITGGTLDGALLSIEQKLNERLRVEGGYRWSSFSDSVYHPRPEDVRNGGAVNALRGKVTYRFGHDKPADVYGEYEQDLSGSAEQRAAIGGEYWLDRRVRAYGRTEFLSSFAGPYTLNDQQQASRTVVGLDADWLRTGRVYSEYRVDDQLEGRQGQAVIGLRNRFTISPGLHLDAGFEHTDATEGGPNLLESTAISGGVEYTRPAGWKATARLEFRDSRLGDDWLTTLGYTKKLNDDWSLLSRGLWSQAENRDQHGRAQVGLAWRELVPGGWNALMRAEHVYEDLGFFNFGLPDTSQSVGPRERRNVDILSAHFNWMPRISTTISPTFAFKSVSDKTRGEAVIVGGDSVIPAPSPVRAEATTWLAQLRVIQDLTKLWDVGATASLLGSDYAGHRFGLGAEVGRRVITNLRAAAGWNVFGFRDSDLRETDYTLRGFYLKLDYKFDEITARAK